MSSNLKKHSRKAIYDIRNTKFRILKQTYHYGLIIQFLNIFDTPLATSGVIILQRLCVYLETLLIGHTFCSMVSILFQNK